MERSKRLLEHILCDRQRPKRELQKYVLISVLILTPFCFLPKLGMAGVILNDANLGDSARSDGKFSDPYPESRFGSPPTRVSIRDHDEEALKIKHVAKSSQNQSEIQSELNVDLMKLSKIQGIVQEVAVIADDLGFFPKAIFVTAHIPVRLYAIGSSKSPLCLMIDQFQVRKQIRFQKIEEINFTPATVGQFRYYCPINGMEGSLIVKELNETSLGSRLRYNQKEAPSEKKSPGE